MYYKDSQIADMARCKSKMCMKWFNAMALDN